MDKSEYEYYIPFTFGRAEIPQGNNLKAKILGVDDGSYFHVAFLDNKRIRGQYEQMLEKMRACARNRYCMPFRLSSTPGIECLVEYPGLRGGPYVRGKVIGLVENSPDSIRVELVDDFLEVVVHRTLIYHTNTSILYFPTFVLKCKLAGMDCFLEHPYLKWLHGEYMKGEWNTNFCTLEVYDRDNRIPTVRLTTSGLDLTDVLQQYIPTFQRLEYPVPEIATQVKITHCDGRGQFWFRPINKMDMISVIESRLFMYNDGYLALKPEAEDLDTRAASWRDHFTKGSGEVLIYKSQDGRMSFRVLKLSNVLTGPGTVNVFYLDYGFTEVVPEDLLVPARLVDPNLCFIPPQSLPIRFIGADCTDDGAKEFNLLRFWKYVSNHQPNFIVMEKANFSSCFPKHVRKESLTPADYVDASLNFLPPECIPIRFIGETLGNVSQQFAFKQFWNVARNMPVSSILARFEIQFGVRGKYLGGILAPEADILVNLQPSQSSQSGTSLYEIYHSRELCLIHGPRSLPWDDWSINSGKTGASPIAKPNSANEITKDDILEHEDPSEWLQWKMTALGNEEDDSVSSLTSSCLASPSSPLLSTDLNNNNVLVSKPTLDTIDINNNLVIGNGFDKEKIEYELPKQLTKLVMV